MIAPTTTYRKAITAEVKTGFTSADDVLKNRLDKLVPILAMDHPAFATDWWNSRNTYESGGGPHIPQTSSYSSVDNPSPYESESSWEESSSGVSAVKPLTPN